MSESEERSLIRNYILGELSKAELKRLEKQIIASDEFFSQILAEEEQMIDDYVYDRMTSETKKRFEETYLLTQEGLEQVELARSLIGLPKTKKDPPRRDSLFIRIFSNPYANIAASAILLCGICFIVWWIYIYPQSDIDAGITALNQAYSKQRTVEPRITAMRYAPLAPTRGAEDTVDIQSQGRARTILRNLVSHNSDAKSHHALGRVYLMEREFDKAIEEFKEALKETERNQKIQSDLGAALFEKGKAEGRNGPGNGKKSLLESLMHLNTAIELDGSLAEAFFNRGLLYQEIGDLESAIVDWKRYLEIDPKSKWSEEVRRKIKSIEK
jgi:tetratricopeptide (TPR) repeat protein